MSDSNPLMKAISSALKANREIEKSFARFGTRDHPRGFVLTEYRNGLRAMKQVLGEQEPLAAALDVLSGMRSSLSGNIRSEFVDMVAFGFEEAARQLSFYEINSIEPSPLILAEQIDAAVDAVLARFDAQESVVRAMILSGAGEEPIVGDDARQGVLRHADILLGTSFWASALVWDAFAWLVGRSSDRFQKQAIAALDGRTSDCCLRVHAQVQPLDGKFRLTGTPRYADRMDWSPFHFWCRTAVALYLPEYDLGLTDKMEKAAKIILEERAAGGGDRHPADAYG